MANQRRAARIRSLVALLFVLLGVVAATVGAGLEWGAGPALVVLGGSLFITGLFIAAVG